MNGTFNINRTALAVSLALGSISAVAAPAKFTANTGVAPNAYVTSTYLHNTNDCGFTCYGNYITEFPSMNDAGVIVGAAKNNLAYVAPKPPIYEPAPKAGGSGGVYAQHGHGLMGCKSPVGGFTVDHVVDAYND